MKQIFGNREVFNNPKPVQLLKDLISLATKQNDIILDSFAGSGTTAHAVLTLNKEDGGNRKFILIECEDYADTITAERVRRVMNSVENATNENLRDGLGGSFTYCTLGEPIDEEDMLTGENLPTYEDFAHYIAYTATGSALTSQHPSHCRHVERFPRFIILYFDWRSLRIHAIISSQRRTELMTQTYTAVIQQDEGWWIGWIQEIPGVNGQERTKDELLEALRITLLEMIEYNRKEAIKAAKIDHQEIIIQI